MFVGANINAMKLEAFKYYYAPADATTGVAGICAKPSPGILKLQADVIVAAKPFMQKTASASAFTAPHQDPATDAAFIKYISTFVPKMSGKHFPPARQHRRRDQGLPRQDAHRDLRVVHLLARRRGCLSTRPLRYGGEATQEINLNP